MSETDKYYFDKKEIDGKIYHVLGKSSDFFEKKGKRIVFGENVEEQIAVIRFKGKLYGLSNICPHRHQDQIFDGYLYDGNVVCPAHGWTYSLESGQNINFKQGIKSLKKYEIFEKDGLVLIEKPVFEIPPWKQTFGND